jgi:hypothetical protein
MLKHLTCATVSVTLLLIISPASSCCLGGYGTSSCKECPNGWFDKRRDNAGVPTTNGARISSCRQATAGYQLWYGSSRCTIDPGYSTSGWKPTQCYQCPAGWIARPGTRHFDCINCPSGVVSNGQCVECTAGQYVNNGCRDCPAGQYSGTFTGQTSCTPCAAGKYCAGTGETSNNNLCSAGSYGSSTGQTSSTCSGLCPLGQYCVAGSTGGTNCPAGTMATTTSGLSQVGSCAPCAAGYTCTSGRGPIGSSAPPAPCGSSGSTIFYCPGGNQVNNRATPQAGYYASNPAVAGTQTFMAQTACEAGWYCTGNGQRIKCPAGRYGSSAGGPWQNSQCEGGCAAGYNCPVGSTNKFSEACAPNPTASAAATYYCPAGQGRQAINTATEYTTPEIGLAGFRTGKATCLAEEYCSGGKRQRRVIWNGAWASCAPASGGAATFTFAEGQDANGDGTTGDYTTVPISASTPVSGGSITMSVSGGTSACETSWTDAPGSYNGQFEVSGTTLQLTNAAKSAGGLVFNNCRPPDGYSVEVQITQGSYSETCKVTIKVGDVNEKPVIAPNQVFTIPENSDPIATCSGGPVTATDSEVDNGIQAITWTIDSGCTNKAGVELTALNPAEKCPFVIGVCDGQLRVATQQYLNPALLDFESTTWRTEYTLQIKANDDGPGGGQYDVKPITLTITDVNEPPEIEGTATDGSNYFTVSEHAADGATVDRNNGIIKSSDVDTKGGHDTQLTFTHHNAGNVPFSVSSTGLVKVDLSDVSTTGGIDFEGPMKERNVIVSVTDSGWGTNPPKPLSTASVAVTVKILDANDAPVIDKVCAEGTGTSVTCQGTILTPDTVIVFPEDCVGTGVSAAGSSLPACTRQLGQSDPDDTTTGSDDTAHFNSNPNGWTLTNSCSGKFAISTAGVLSVDTNPINYEAAVAASAANDPFCTITAKVEDQSNAAATISFKVKIADVNEAPSALTLIAKGNLGQTKMNSNTDCWTYENDVVNTVACALTSSDPDIRAAPSAQSHAYSITGGTGITADGNTVRYAVYNSPATVALYGSSSPTAGTAIGASIVLVGNLNFETTNSYTLNLKVTDSGFQRPFSLSATNTITVFVKDVNEAPSFTNLETTRSVDGRVFVVVFVSLLQVLIFFFLIFFSIFRRM